MHYNSSCNLKTLGIILVFGIMAGAAKAQEFSGGIAVKKWSDQLKPYYAAMEHCLDMQIRTSGRFIYG